MYSLKNLIAKEDPKAVQHDLQIIDQARVKYWDEDGWDELQISCVTEIAKQEVHNIEMRKYHRSECSCGML